MAAAMAVEQDLYPSGLGHELLRCWAPFARDDREGRASWNVKPRVDHGYWGDPPESYWATDKIISPFKRSALIVKRTPWLADDRDRQNAEYWEPVARMYLGEQEPAEIASGLGWSELRVRTVLCVFAGLVEREYRDMRGIS